MTNYVINIDTSLDCLNIIAYAAFISGRHVLPYNRPMAGASDTYLVKLAMSSMCGSRGVGQGVQTPLENYKKVGFLSNTGPDPLKTKKLPSQHSMLGRHRPPAKHHLNDVSLAGC